MLKRHIQAALITALVTFGALYCSDAHSADLLTPGAIYSLGSAADWSASRYALLARPELREVNRLGLNAGAVFTGALFMGSDLWLQHKRQRGAVKVLRVVYCIGVGALVANSLVKAQGAR